MPGSVITRSARASNILSSGFVTYTGILAELFRSPTETFWSQRWRLEGGRDVLLRVGIGIGERQKTLFQRNIFTSTRFSAFNTCFVSLPGFWRSSYYLVCSRFHNKKVCSWWLPKSYGRDQPLLSSLPPPIRHQDTWILMPIDAIINLDLLIALSPHFANFKSPKMHSSGLRGGMKGHKNLWGIALC